MEIGVKQHRTQNFDVARERREQQPDKDWKFGAVSQPGVISVPEAEREAFLPLGETQYGREDFQDCATRSPINKLADDFTYALKHNLLPQDLVDWLKPYTDANGRIDFSDRYIAVLSGTTRQGNSLKSPLEAIRKNGLIPKSMLPKKANMTWEEYNDPKAITQEMKDLGAEFLRRFVVNYEQVARIHFETALEGDMLCVGGHAWTEPVNGEYPKTDLPINHAFLIYKRPMAYAFDNYEEEPGDYIKKLAPNYNFFDYGYRVYISSVNPAPDIQVNVFSALSLAGLLSFFMDWYNRFIKEQSPQPEPLPTVPPTAPPAQHVSKIPAWALAIEKQEGGKPSDLNITQRNPGNLKYSTYTATFKGATKGVKASDGGYFCRFPTRELGLNALEGFLTDACNGRLQSYKPTDTLDKFTTTYALPPNKNYVKAVAKALGVTPETPIKELL